jgi:hypothetical protein
MGRHRPGLPKPLVRDGFIEAPTSQALGIDDIDDEVIAAHVQEGATWEPHGSVGRRIQLGPDVELRQRP